MEMINPNDYLEVARPIDQCMLGCGPYCNCLDYCFDCSLCPLCAVKVEICPIYCICGLNK